jgi:hypothetical protein
MIRTLPRLSALVATVAASLIAATAWAAPSGWRMDGTNTSSTATPPWQVSSTNLLYAQSLPASGNASVVLMGDKVCGTAEPTITWCAASSNGAMLWSKSTSWADTAAPADREAAKAKQAEADAAAARFEALQRDYSATQKAARSSGDAALYDKLTQITAEMETVKVVLDASAAWRTPKDRELIGYATATPATDGTNLYVLFGNGVLARFDSAGNRTWAIWLGDGRQEMNGYHVGTTASPLLAGGTLIVPFGKLRGIDPATGAVKWTGGTWKDYGSPAVTQVGGVWLVATPDGKVLGASDGREYARDLGAVWYSSPVAVGDRVYWIGGKEDAHTQATGGAKASAAQISVSGGSVRVTSAWRTDLGINDRFYASPVVYDYLIYTVSRNGTVVAMRAYDGGVLYTASLRGTLSGQAWQNPVAANGLIFLGSDTGQLFTLRAGAAYELLATSSVGRYLGSPVLSGGRMYIRTFKNLSAWRN